MQFWLRHSQAAGQADVTHIEQALFFSHRVAAGDDRQPVFPGKSSNQIHIARGVFRKPAHPLVRRKRFRLGKQLDRDQFREQHEIRFIIGGHIGEIGNLPREIRERLHLAHLVLHASHPHLAAAGSGRLVIRVEPFDEAGVVVAPGIVQIVRHHPAQNKTFAQLKTQHQILQFARRDPIGVFLGRHLVGVPRIVPQTSARKDAALVQAPAQLPPRLIERRANAQAARIRMHINIRAVKRVRVGVVVGEITAVRDA